ncbi:hypothetical protein ACC703_39235, partial [Rhizobium ruizarguesonis]
RDQPSGKRPFLPADRRRNDHPWLRRPADVGDVEDLRSGTICEIAQFSLAEVVCREGKDIAIDVAKLVIEEGSDHALGEFVI